MALSAYLSAVNQKLLFAAQLLATDIKTSVSGQQDSHQAAAIAQSVALQLQRAWYWHLQDVASNYKMQDPEAVVSAASLLTLLDTEGKTPGEAIELNDQIRKSAYSFQLRNNKLRILSIRAFVA